MDLVYKEFDEAHDKVSHSYPGITRRTAWGLTPYITATVQKSPFHRRGMRWSPPTVTTVHGRPPESRGHRVFPLQGHAGTDVTPEKG